MEEFTAKPLIFIRLSIVFTYLFCKLSRRLKYKMERLFEISNFITFLP
jgi:hypothetical protein